MLIQFLFVLICDRIYFYGPFNLIKMGIREFVRADKMDLFNEVFFGLVLWGLTWKKFGRF